MLGQTISRYRIVSQLGAGGMGVVYRAEDLRLGRLVALKFLPEELAKDQQAVDRLRFEARAASALNHAHICTIYDIDEHDGQPFIAMELMKGQTLRDRLAGDRLKIHQLVDIGIQIGDALDAAHAQGVVHRDIKPGNIFLTDRNQVKILDFGLAKLSPHLLNSGTTRGTHDHLTALGQTLGTVSYMSPEQATGEELDGRTDLFSLGVVLYECATGHQPFTGKTSAVILAAILNRAPVAPVVFNPELPLRLQEVINNCLEKDRELRYQSAADLRADLKRVRRDIESGHSQVIDAVARQDAPRISGTTPPYGRKAPSAGTDHSPAPVTDSKPVRSRVPLVIVAVTVVVLIAAAPYLLRPPAPTTNPDTTRVAALSEAAVRSRLDLANASLEAKNYRSALAYSAEVLAGVPDHAAAAKIRDEARAMIARFDAAIAEARRRADTGDAQGASQALETARLIDPTAPTVTEISARLARQVKTPPEAEKQPAQRSPLQARSANEPARPEPQRDAASQPPPPSPATTTAPPQIPPRNDTPPVPVPPAPAPAGAAALPPAAPEPVAPAAKPTAPPAPPAPVERRDPAPLAAPSSEDDEVAIRRVVATYARAIESKDVSLFRSIKPNLSREEERRLQDGFRAVLSQQVNVTVLAIDRRGEEVTVLLRRRDTIQAGGRQQTSESQQTMRLMRTAGGWVIRDIR